MKKTIITLLIALCAIQLTAQRGIGTTSPSTNAVLHLASADSAKGLIIPIVTNTKRPSPSSAIVGMMVYNLTDSCIQVCNGVDWNCLKQIYPTDTTEWSNEGLYIMAARAAANGDTVVITDDGNIGIGTTTPTQTLDVNGSLHAAGKHNQVFTRNLGGNAGDLAYLGTIHSSGDGSCIDIELSIHTINSLVTLRYTLCFTYLGGDTHWYEILPTTGTLYGGVRPIALDVQKLNSSPIVNLRIRRISGGQGTVSAKIVSDEKMIEDTTVAAGGTVTDIIGSQEYNFVSRNDYWGGPSGGVYIKSSGKVGIGKTDPQARLHVTDLGGNAATDYTAIFTSNPFTGGSGGILFDQNSTYAYKVHTENTSSDTLGLFKFSYINQSAGNTIYDDILVLNRGNVGIGTVSPTQTLSVNGTAGKSGGGAWATYSDIRTKKNIQPFTDGLNVISQINPITFQYNEKSGYTDLETKYVGFSAQAIEKIAPYMVTQIDDSENSGLSDKRVFDESALTKILVNAIKELQEEIKVLKEDNSELNAKNEKTEETNKNIEARLTQLEQLLLEASTQKK